MAKRIIDLSPWQVEVSLDKHRYKVINCGRRAGKSFLVSVHMLQFATENAKSVVWYVSPNYKQSKQIMWAMLHDLIPPEIIASKNETELKFVLSNGSEICLKGAQEPDSLRGVRIDLCIFDETAFINKWEETWKVIRPTLIDSKASVWFISTPNGFNHFKDMSEITDEQWKYFHYTTYDNPYIDRTEIDLMRRDMDEDSFAQEVMGEFKKMSGMIYKDFTRETHMVDIPNLDFNYTFTRSLDFGYGHKTALLYFAISSTGEAIYCYDGLYQSGLVESQIADVVKAKDANKTITNPVADSAQPMSIEQLRQFGVNFNPVEKGPDSVKNGIVKVAELLRIRADTGKPTLMFNKNLTWIADEFEQYRWVEAQQDGVIKEVPYKVNDDACFVAGTKITTPNGIKNIEELKDGDLVCTPFGNSAIVGYGCTGRRPIKDYGCFKSTPTHKVLTNRGIVKVDSIRYNDIVCKIEDQKPFTLIRFLTDAIRNQDTERIDYIFKGLLTRNLEAKRAFYTGMFGYTIMAKSLLVLRSITLTMILRTMIFLISNWLHTKSMLKNMVGGIGKAVKNTLRRLTIWQKNGTQQKKVWRFIRKLAACPTRIENCLQKNVRSVVRNSQPILVRANTVIKTAKQQHYEEEEVYNLATSNGMYFANGVLVSNCDAIRYFAMTYKKQSDVIPVINLTPYRFDG